MRMFIFVFCGLLACQMLYGTQMQSDSLSSEIPTSLCSLCFINHPQEPTPPQESPSPLEYFSQVAGEILKTEGDTSDQGQNSATFIPVVKRNIDAIKPGKQMPGRRGRGRKRKREGVSPKKTVLPLLLAVQEELDKTQKSTDDGVTEAKGSVLSPDDSTQTSKTPRQKRRKTTGSADNAQEEKKKKGQVHTPQLAGNTKATQITRSPYCPKIYPIYMPTDYIYMPTGNIRHNYMRDGNILGANFGKDLSRAVPPDLVQSSKRATVYKPVSSCRSLAPLDMTRQTRPHRDSSTSVFTRVPPVENRKQNHAASVSSTPRPVDWGTTQRLSFSQKPRKI